MKNRVSTCRSSAYYVSAGKKKCFMVQQISRSKKIFGSKNILSHRSLAKAKANGKLNFSIRSSVGQSAKARLSLAKYDQFVHDNVITD